MFDRVGVAGLGRKEHYAVWINFLGFGPPRLEVFAKYAGRTSSPPSRVVVLGCPKGAKLYLDLTVGGDWTHVGMYKELNPALFS